MGMLLLQLLLLDSSFLSPACLNQLVITLQTTKSYHVTKDL